MLTSGAFSSTCDPSPGPGTRIAAISSAKRFRERRTSASRLHDTQRARGWFITDDNAAFAVRRGELFEEVLSPRGVIALLEEAVGAGGGEQSSANTAPPLPPRI